MLAIINETLDRRLKLDPLIPCHPLLNKSAHDDSSAIELIRVPVQALILIRNLDVP